MKRKVAFFGIMLSLILVLCVATSFGDNSSVNSWAKYIKSNYAGTTITFATTRHPATDAMQKMYQEFNKLTGINVKWDVIEEGYLRNKLLLEHQGLTRAYDMLLIDSFNLSEYVPAGVCQKLEGFLANKKLTPAWYNYNDLVGAYRDGIGKLQGKIYGIPVAGETRFVAYRKDLFEKYKKQPPQTMDEMLELAKFFNGKEKGLYGIAMRAQKGIHFASGMMTVMYQLGGQYLDEKDWKVLVNSPKTVDSLKYYVELLNQGPPDISTYTHEEAISAFSMGKTAMWFDSTALSPWILDPEKSLVSEEVGFVPPPKGSKGHYGVLAGWDIGISPDSSKKKQEAVWAFIVWMTSQAKAKEYVNLGGTPVRTSVLQDPEMVKKNVTFPIQLESLKCAGNMVNDGIHWLAPHPKFIKVIEVVGNYGSQVLAGQIEAKDAMDKAQSECEQIMKEK